MNTDRAVKMADMKAKLSTLWIFVVLNYLYADVMGLMDPAMLSQFITGRIGSIHITRKFLLGAAILMELPISMVVLSRVLRYTTNRLANITAGTIMTAVQFASLFVGSSPTGYYIFFSIVEIACTSSIVWCAWKWPAPEDGLDGSA